MQHSKSCRAWSRWFSVFVFAVCAGRVGAQERNQLLTLDASRSYVEFEVKVLWLVGVRGRFNSLRGNVVLDHFRNSATVDVRIDTNAVTMRNKTHEEWVKSEEFFDAKHFPEIQFVSESIPLQRLQAGGGIDGLLTLRGISQRVHFEVSVPSCATNSTDNCPVHAEGSIHRSDFGMSSRRGALADKVDLSFSIATVPPAGDPKR